MEDSVLLYHTYAHPQNAHTSVYHIAFDHMLHSPLALCSTILHVA